MFEGGTMSPTISLGTRCGVVYPSVGIPGVGLGIALFLLAGASPFALDRCKNAAAIDDCSVLLHHADDHSIGVWDTHQQHATCLSKIKFFQTAQPRRTHPS